MARITKIVALSFSTITLPVDFCEKWECDLDKLDCEFQDHIPVTSLDPKFVVATCNELGLGENSRKHEITHIESTF